MIMLKGLNPGTLNLYSQAAYSVVAPSNTETVQCCEPLKTIDGFWAIGCDICLSSSIPLQNGLVIEDVVLLSSEEIN
jgi:hypothetical protein